MIRLFISRPVAVAMVYLALGILGFAVWRNLPLALLPDTQLPRLGVQAQWPVASAEMTGALVTAPPARPGVALLADTPEDCAQG